MRMPALTRQCVADEPCGEEEAKAMLTSKVAFPLGRDTFSLSRITPDCPAASIMMW